ncbi:MAG: hypothetical protein RL299_595, partial [Pseudomonadota bacterium]
HPVEGFVGKAHEAVDVIVTLEGEALLAQDLQLDLQRQHFAVDQNPVAIEDDGLEQV